MSEQMSGLTAERAKRGLIAVLALCTVFAVAGCDRADDGYTTPEVDTDRDQPLPPPAAPANPDGTTR